MIDKSDKFFISLRVSHSLGGLERVSVFTLLFHSPSARFQEANWKDAGENVQVFPEPGQEPSRASLDVRTRGLPKAYGPASQIRLHSEPLTRDSILTTPDWLRMWRGGGDEKRWLVVEGEEFDGKNRSPWCLSGPGQIPVSSLTGSELSSPL